MGTETRIVDLDRPGETVGPPDGESASATAELDWLNDAAPDADAEDAGPRPPRLAPVLLALAALTWTGFFGYGLWAEGRLPRDFGATSAAIAGWAPPVLLILLVWLLVLRGSRSEALRFADAGARFRNEIESAEARLKAMTSEVALARALIDAEARRLETLGREASAGLAGAAGELGALFDRLGGEAETLDRLTGSARGNLAALREELPVAGSATRDLTNQIGAAGRAAQAQLAGLKDAVEAAGRSGATLRETLGDIEARTAAAGQRSAAQVAEMRGTIDALVSGIEARGQEVLAARRDALTEIGEKLDGLAERQQQQLAAQLASLTRGMQEVERGLAAFGTATETRIATIDATLGGLAAREAGQRERLAALDAENQARISASADALGALGGAAEQLAERLAGVRGDAASLAGEVSRLFADVEARQDQLGQRLEPDLARLLERAGVARDQLDQLGSRVAALANEERTLGQVVSEASALAGERGVGMAQLLEESRTAMAEREAQAAALAALIADTRHAVDGLAASAADRLDPALGRVRDAASSAIEDSRSALDSALDSLLDRFRARLDAELGAQADRIAQSLENQLAERIGGARRRIETLEVAADNLEARIANSGEQLPRHDDAGFARQMGLLVESMNSASIDVAKLLSTEVTDTAWSAYLKGDRSVFTRRAVRLLSAAESRSVAHAYEQDGEFREQVNRYIHDFEAMIRGLLSTRDGGALSVTLLSSDVGKLYVALAQAIERLRS